MHDGAERWQHDHMKRLVVCCDGTWNKPDNENVTNVEKIARTVQSDPSATGGVYQFVYYISGVGAGSYEADRLLGGAFGFGLFHNVIACYRFLAQNYEPDDEIFIVGFSRGAYTARSVAGMLATVGLLTKVALVEERLPEAVHLYQGTKMPEGAFGESVDEFKHDHCHAGEGDLPRCLRHRGRARRPRLRERRAALPQRPTERPGAVRSASIGDRRDQVEVRADLLGGTRASLPTLRLRTRGSSRCGSRVRTPMSEGAMPQTGLSDTSLLWMAREAHAAGLVFDAGVVGHVRQQRVRPHLSQPPQPDVQGRQPDSRSEAASAVAPRGQRVQPRAAAADQRPSLVRAGGLVGGQPLPRGWVRAGQHGGVREARQTDSRGSSSTSSALPEAGLDLTDLGTPSASPSPSPAVG